MWKLILPKQSWWLRVILASLQVCREYSNQHSWESIPNTIFKQKIISKLWFEQNADGAMLIKQSELARYFWLITNFGWSNEKAITATWLNFLDSSEDLHKLIWILVDSMTNNNVSFWRNSEAVETSDSDIEPPKVFLRSIDSLRYMSANEYAYLLNELNDNWRNYDDIIKEIQVNRTKASWSELNRVEFGQKYIKPENINKYFDIKFTSLFEEIWLIAKNESHEYIFGRNIQGDISLLNKIKKLNIHNNVSTMITIPPLQTTESLTSQESLLLLSLLTKPFSILYWVSWTWKSRVVRELWKKLYSWYDDNGNEKYLSYFQKEAVPPNWFDDSEIIWRYNKVEWFIQGGFTKFLEKAISDPVNNYIYLLDEMNLSHVEQYFSQYLSAIEDLNENKWWINIWNTDMNSSVSEEDQVGSTDDISNESNENQFDFDFNHPVNLSGKEFVKWVLQINGDTISYERKNQNTSEFSNFHKLIIKYIVDNYSDDIERFWFKTIEQIKEQYSSIYIKWMDINEDIDSFILKNQNSDNGLVLHVNNEVKVYFYKGYFSVNSFGLAANRLAAIQKLVSLISENALNGLHITFKDKLGKNKQNTIIEPFKSINGIIKFYEEWTQVWKSLCLPKNFFVVWTINLDETTKSISPKVVDRANLIEFNDLDDFLFIKDINKYNLDFLKSLSIPHKFSEIQEIKDLILSLKNDDEIPKEFKLSLKNEDLLSGLYWFLKIFKLHFSYRTLKEILLFINIGKKLWIDNEDKLLDIAIIQKILPKLNGIIDSNFKLSSPEWSKFLYYEYDSNDIGLLSEFKDILIEGLIDNTNFSNSRIKLKRMQSFFNTYQNVNYFLS
jgi:hypothetical protein